MKKIGRAIKQVWKLGSPYWLKSPDRVGSYLLVVMVIAVTFIGTLMTVRFNYWNNDWTNAYTNVNQRLWLQQMWIFVICVGTMQICGNFNIYVGGWIALRWRTWMTNQMLGNWMTDHNHYRMQINVMQRIENPDQRISEDINAFITSAWTYTFSLGQQLLTLGSFMIVLWSLSNQIPLYIRGVDYSFPGYFIVLSFVYAIISLAIVHFFGKHLVKLQYQQVQREADFRYSLVRIRENSEQIALLNGEKVEHANLMGIFQGIVDNTLRVLMRTMKFNIANGMFATIDGVFFSILLAPSYFAGYLPGGYGTIMQVSAATQNVLNVFKFFQTNYPMLSVWKACINRLHAFVETAEKTDEITRASGFKLVEQNIDDLVINDLEVNLPDGRLQITAKDISLHPGQKILIKGRTGAGKTTLFRVLSGIWPYGKGNVVLPKNKKVIMLPQKPYLPIGTLLEAVSYPNPADTYKREDVQKALQDVGLNNLVERLDEYANWGMLLSGGEQQRVGVARAMLFDPDYLFFDEATASMDEPSEEELYTMLLERLPDTTIISIGHRSSLEKFHNRLLYAEKIPAGNYEFQER